MKVESYHPENGVELQSLDTGQTFVWERASWIKTDEDDINGLRRCVRLRDGFLQSVRLTTLVTPYALKAVPDTEAKS